jgi:DNA-binding NarL/FixJ family response regulator
MSSIPSSTLGALDRGAVRVGIVDDHALLGDLLVHMLNEKGFTAVGLQPSELGEVLRFAQDECLHVVLLDLDLGELGMSIPVIPALREAGCRVIMVTGSTERPVWGACIEAGAATVMNKSISFDELVGRVTELLDDVVEQRQTERAELLDELRRHREQQRQRLAPFAQLTDRENQVLHELMRGKSADEIAAATYVSIATVRTHIRSILQKLGVSSQLAAVALAIQAGWDPR